MPYFHFIFENKFTIHSINYSVDNKPSAIYSKVAGLADIQPIN
jgi:hypothetical protein